MFQLLSHRCLVAVTKVDPRLIRIGDVAFAAIAKSLMRRSSAFAATVAVSCDVRMLVTEATVIADFANGWNESPGIYTDEMAAGWNQVTNAVHQAGGAIFLQLWHCGRASHSSFVDGKLPMAPSAIAINGDYIHTPNGKQPYEVPRAIETAEIAGIVKDYQLAARRAKQAGFDGVEIHGANG